MMPNKANPVDAILLGLMEGAKHVKTPIQSTLSEVKKAVSAAGRFPAIVVGPVEARKDSR